MKKIILTIGLLTLSLTGAFAQKETTKGIILSKLKGFEYGIKAGLNIGGTSPIPLPVEIRSIDSYMPRLSLSIEANVLKWFDDKWGIESGIRIDNQGMKTNATVKNYKMKIVGEDGEIGGMWTGGVRTNVSHTYITIPMLATYKITPRWRLQGGLFASYALDADFSGSVNNGYLRKDTPIGEKMGVDYAVYDFSGDLAKWQWGAQIGGEWLAFKHLTVHSNLTWGFADIFEKDFETITFGMYPIYLNLGFGYAF